jgi:hypothetical protein
VPAAHMIGMQFSDLWNPLLNNSNELSVIS